MWPVVRWLRQINEHVISADMLFTLPAMSVMLTWWFILSFRSAMCELMGDLFESEEKEEKSLICRVLRVKRNYPF